MQVVNEKVLFPSLPQYISGYLHGSKYPLFKIKLEISVKQINCEHLKKIYCFFEKEVFRHAAIDQIFSTTDINSDQLIKFIITAHNALCYLAGNPVAESARVIAKSENSDGYLLILPTLHDGQKSTIASLDWLVSLINDHSNNLSTDDFLKSMSRAVERMKKWLPPSSNTPHLLAAAYSLNIPFTLISGDLCSFGLGVRQILMSSTFTNVTPVISVNLARNKVLTSKLLREALLPVPEGRLVKDLDDAINYAKHIKFPVVIKPSDLDGGRGVAAGIVDVDELEEAYLAAKKLSSRILLEKHFVGSDFRVVVFRGEVIWVAQRLPGGVRGDGVSTIRELVDTLNGDPSRSSPYRATLKQLKIDDEANLQLKKIGMTSESIPKAGEYVSLRRTANIGNGGMPVNRTADIHPDNAKLAIEAARVLNLDLAGIDLLCADIGVSWKETGAIICEVNSQPSLGATISKHLYPSLLKKIIKGNGRIPIIAICGLIDNQLLTSIVNELRAFNLIVGYTNSLGDVYIQDIVHTKNCSLFDGGRMLLSNRLVNAAVLTVDHKEMSIKGLPFDRCDLALIGDSINQSFLSSLKMACMGPILDLRVVDQSPITHKNKVFTVDCEAAVIKLKEIFSKARLV